MAGALIVCLGIAIAVASAHHSRVRVMSKETGKKAASNASKNVEKQRDGCEIEKR
jgi:hypothetical protein